MALREEFERSGNWLFRWRSYLPVLLYGLVFAALSGATYPQGSWRLNEWWEAICLAVALSGVAVRATVVGFTPHGTSGRNTREGQIASSLNTTGMYALVRHPLYLGNFLIWLGIAMRPRSAWLALVVALIFCLYYERIMFAEEEYLRAKFGGEYERWAASTPAIVPWPWRWRTPSLPFSLRNVLRREYSAVLAIGVSFAMIDVVENFVVTGYPRLDVFAGAVLGVATACYVSLLTLKRHTRALRVSGR